MNKVKKNIEKYSAKYFMTTVESLKEKNNLSTLKFFCFEDNITICGISLIKPLIMNQLSKEDLKLIEIFSLKDGDITNSNEPVIVITGDYRKFAILEGIIDGILTRLSSIATNVREVINIVGKKSLVFMADRSDLYLNQPYDGYAGYVGGARKFVTQAMVELIDENDTEQIGTMPHSLIQQHGGNLINALKSFHQNFPFIGLTALIDYHNDCVGEIIKLANDPISKYLVAVRIDTSSVLVDKSLQIGDWVNNQKLRGVCSKLILIVRQSLDYNGFKNVKIIATSSINKNKILEFKKLNIPVDIYGIGSALLKKSCHFTADLIQLNEKYEGKFGRIDPIEKYLVNLNKWVL